MDACFRARAHNARSSACFVSTYFAKMSHIMITIPFMPSRLNGNAIGSCETLASDAATGCGSESSRDEQA
jgi:hypothetical protein